MMTERMAGARRKSVVSSKKQTHTNSSKQPNEVTFQPITIKDSANESVLKEYKFLDNTLNNNPRKSTTYGANADKP